MGKTSRTPAERLREHLKPSSTKRSLPCGRWVQKHAGQIVMDILEEVADGGALDDCERSWIRQYRALGQADLNVSDGGDGVTGRSPSEEERRRISQSLISYYKTNKNPFAGRTHSAESKQKMSESAKRRGVTENQLRSLEMGRTGPKGAETLRRASVRNTGEGNPSAKIDREKAVAIWDSLQSEWPHKSMSKIAEEHGVKRSTVSNIKYGLAWAFATGAGR